MLITRVSMFSGKTHSREIDVTQQQLDDHASGKDLIQNIMPNLGLDDREFILTGITPEEWDEAMGDSI